MKLKSYIVGYNAVTGKIEIYNNESDAILHCVHWTTVEATDRKEARREYEEKYKPVIEE